MPAPTTRDLARTTLPWLPQIIRTSIPHLDCSPVVWSYLHAQPTLRMDLLASRSGARQTLAALIRVQLTRTVRDPYEHAPLRPSRLSPLVRDTRRTRRRQTTF